MFEPFSNFALVYTSSRDIALLLVAPPSLRLHLPFAAVWMWSGGFRTRNFTVQGSLKPPGGGRFDLFFGDDASRQHFRVPSRANVRWDHVFFSNLLIIKFNITII